MRPPLKFARWCKAPSVRPRCKVLVQKVLVQSNASMQLPDAVQSSSPRATQRRRANPRAKCPCSASMSCNVVSRPSCNAVPSCKVPVQHPNTKPAVQSAHTTPPPPPQSTPPSCNSPPRHTGALMVTTGQFPATPHGGADHLYRATPPSCNTPPLHTEALSLPSNPTIMQYPAPPLWGADGHHRAIPRHATRGR